MQLHGKPQDLALNAMSATVITPHGEYPYNIIVVFHF